MENLGVSFSTKSRSPQQIMQYKSYIQNRFANHDGQNKTSSTNQKTTVAREECFENGFCPKANERKKTTADFFLSKRPSTAIGGIQKKSELIERDRNSGLQTSQSFFSDAGRERRRSLTHSKERQQFFNKPKVKSVKNHRNNYTEDLESLSLLSKAMFEQGKIIEKFCLAREGLLKKMTEKMRPDKKPEEVGEGYKLEYVPRSGKNTESPSFPDFENSYSGNLEEIFQAWVHLFYFIINLRINLIRILNCVDSEICIPKGDVEKEIIEQAIECVKFFSLLKIKSMADSLDEFRAPNGQQMTQIQMRNYEQKLSSPFLCEMNFIQKKARDILYQAKTFTTT